MDKDNYTEMWIKCMNSELKFYKELINYLANESVGNIESIICAIADHSYNRFEGLVKVTKSVNDRQQVSMRFKNKDGEQYTAQWQPAYNYAVWQGGGGMTGDDYQGYLLFPTRQEDTYFLLEYNC